MILQITPYYPPDVSGVGDYAYELHQYFTKKNKDSQVISYHPRTPESMINFHYVHPFTFKAGSDSLDVKLASLCENDAIILHYVGYGYAKRGAPYHLARILRYWKGKNPNVKLHVMFHELYATGPITSSAFWLSGFQRRIARQLLLLCDGATTNCQLYCDILKNWCSEKKIICCEVFSTVGEPTFCSKDEPPFAVVFGTAGNRKKVYELVDQWQDELFAEGVRNIVDIGKVQEEYPQLGSFKLIQQGFMEREAVSHLMSSAKFGLLYYPKNYLGKSTICAAYLAHGVVPINLHPTVLAEMSVAQQLQNDPHQCMEIYKKRSIINTAELFIKALDSVLK